MPLVHTESIISGKRLDSQSGKGVSVVVITENLTIINPNGLLEKGS